MGRVSQYVRAQWCKVKLAFGAGGDEIHGAEGRLPRTAACAVASFGPCASAPRDQSMTGV